LKQAAVIVVQAKLELGLDGSDLTVLAVLAEYWRDEELRKPIKKTW